MKGENRILEIPDDRRPRCWPPPSAADLGEMGGAPRNPAPTANLRTKIVDFRGFDSSIMLILRGGISRPIGDFPETLRQSMLVGIMLVWKLGVGATFWWIVKPSGRHRSDALGGSRYRRVPTPLRSTSPSLSPIHFGRFSISRLAVLPFRCFGHKCRFLLSVLPLLPAHLVWYRGHTEMPHPQTSDSMNLINATCSEKAKFCVYLI